METKVEGGVRKNGEIVIDVYTPLILSIKEVTNEDILHSTGNSV